MRNMFLPERLYKNKAEMETCDAKKGAASPGLGEMFDITVLVARSQWPAAFRKHPCLQMALRRNTFRSILPLFCKTSPQKCYCTEMANTVNL